MRILIVASGNHKQVAPFVVEQAEALRKEGNTVDLFLVKGHGIIGYLGNLKTLKAVMRQFNPDIIHAHYGLSGLLCTLQKKVPVVVTYHGSDLNSRHTRPLCQLAMRRAAYNIFVNAALQEKSHLTSQKSMVLPCGIDLNLFAPASHVNARQQLGLNPNGRYVLFTGAFKNKVKNAPLAKAACSLIPNTELLELCNRSRQEVALLMNAANVLLVTSFHEGSPQVVKEALACNLPVVSVDAGDIATMLHSTQGGIISQPTPQDLASKMMPFLDSMQRTHAREYMNTFDNAHIASQICSIYKNIVHE